MDYKKLCEVYEALEKTSKGLEKTEILADFLGEIKEHPEYIYLIQGNVFADYDSRELGLSIQLIIKAIAKASGHTEHRVIQEFKETGDLGLAAKKLFANKKQLGLFATKLSTTRVINSMRKIPELIGKGTISTKIDFVVDLLHSASGIEAKYIVRTVLGDLKIGVGSGIIRDAIAVHCFKPKNIAEKKHYAQIVQDAYDKATDFALVYDKACKNELEHIKLSVGKPVKVMLYPKAKDAEDALKIVGSPAVFEYKYDGFRMMINKLENGEIKIFTRRLENVSNQFPEVVEAVNKNIKGKTFIIDGEAVGYDPKTQTYKEFQAISQRIKRKHEIERLAEELPVELRIFDIIYYEGESLIEKEYTKRRKLIEKITTEKKWDIGLAKQITTGNIEEAQKFFEKALEDGQEGLMVKGLDKKYKPGARIGYGVKWKPEDKDFDLVITGAEWGTGKRAGWLTSFDVACQDESGQLLEIGKVGAGLKEKKEEGLSFEELTEKLKKITTHEKDKHITVKPKYVVTVKYQNIQKSPGYSSGFGLRFPRITRLRPDRGPEDIATVEEIEKEV